MERTLSSEALRAHAGEEGFSFRRLGLVAGLDLRHPAIKLPGFGRIGLARDTRAVAAPR
jgi:hypothetical protein